MKLGIIRVGDSTDHGGIVLATRNNLIKVRGIYVALLGDPCSCPKTGHRNCTIAEGHPKIKIKGIPVAFHGYRLTCGAILESSIPDHGYRL